jgi:hypothetical protein
MAVQAKPLYYDTLIPYKTVASNPIQYTTCKPFDHISRHKGLRQIIHHPFENDERFIALETPNYITTRASFIYYTVPKTEEDRLDLIAEKFLGSAQYGWVIAYFNDIEDGYTVYEGQKLRIIKQFTALFNKHEILAPIPAMLLNLGVE